MKFLIDMNLSPNWEQQFIIQGWQARHWSKIGKGNAPDEEILAWAKENSYIIFTHDLDFGAILAATKADSPSVIQIRSQDVTPSAIKDILFAAIQEYQPLLQSGSLIVVHPNKSRARILPLKTD